MPLTRGRIPFIGAMAYRSTNTPALGASSSAAINFDTVQFEYGADIARTNQSRIFLPIRGLWFVSLNLGWVSASTSGSAFVTALINGSTPFLRAQYVAPPAGNASLSAGGRLIESNGSDYIEITHNTAAGAASVILGSQNTNWSCYFLGDK